MGVSVWCVRSRIASVLPRVCSLKLHQRSQGMWLRLGVLLWVWALYGVLALGPCATAKAQVGALTWADKMLSERKYDFGSPPAGTGATHTITITNLYKETVTISEVISSSSVRSSPRNP